VPGLRNVKLWSLAGFGIFLTLLCRRAYQYPEYSTDGFSYMANAVAMSGASIQEIHDAVYREAKATIRAPIYAHLTGNDLNQVASEASSFHQREINAYRFAEFLPCFAIRPVFTELIYVLHYWFGIRLLKAEILIPVVSYWLMGWLVLAWMARYVAVPSAALISALLLFCAPLWALARSTTPDALSSLAVLAALFLLFERRQTLPGTILLLVSVWIRTDNVVLVLLALGFLWISKSGLRLSAAILLSAVAIASVFVINHFAGDYGAKVLYYRSFIEAPIAVGEIVPVFGLREYLAALKAAISVVVHGAYVPFFLVGCVGLLRWRSRAVVFPLLVTTSYTIAHLVIFPNPEARFFGPFFVLAGLGLASMLPSERALQLMSSPPVSREDERIQAMASIAG
jgi:hypothetical protein